MALESQQSGERRKIEQNLTSQQNSIKWFTRPMRRRDIDKCLIIWNQVELTEAHHTVASALQFDPDAFYVAELELTGEVIGMCAGPKTREDTAFMGFYAVDPRFQRMGIGRELWSRTVNRLDKSMNIGLYGVPAMSEKYKKSGFEIEDSIRMLIFESNPNETHNLALDRLKNIGDLPAPDPTNADWCIGLQVIDGNTNEALFSKLIEFDDSVNKFSREKLLRLYLQGKDVPLTLAVVKEVVATKEDKSTGVQVPTFVSQDEMLRQNLDGASQPHHSTNQRKMSSPSSCCAKLVQGSQSTIETETNELSVGVKSSLCISSESVMDKPAGSQVCGGSAKNMTSKCCNVDAAGSMLNQNTDFEVLGYGCIRHDNTSGGIIGPIYANSASVCEVLLRNLISLFELPHGGKYSVMALTSNTQACTILQNLGLNEMDQCSRMFTKFVPLAEFEKIYYVHSPNFTLF